MKPEVRNFRSPPKREKTTLQESFSAHGTKTDLESNEKSRSH